MSKRIRRLMELDLEKWKNFKKQNKDQF